MGARIFTDGTRWRARKIGAPDIEPQLRIICEVAKWNKRWRFVLLTLQALS